MRDYPTPDAADIARDLAAAGWSLRRISRRLQLNRKTLQRVLSGPLRLAEIEDDPFFEIRQRARRCRGCGGLVYQWPCLACQLRGRAERAAA